METDEMSNVPPLPSEEELRAAAQKGQSTAQSGEVPTQSGDAAAGEGEVANYENVVNAPAATQPGEFAPAPAKRFTQTLGFKVGFIVVLSLLLLIPTLMIGSLSDEREMTARDSRAEISDKWGRPQHVTGPVLAIPYVTKNRKDSVEERHMVYVLPKELNVQADVKSEKLYRSIYETVVYTTGIDLDGSFTLKGLLPKEIDPAALQMDKAFLEVGLTDLRGISQKLVVDLNGSKIDVNDGGKDGNINAEYTYERPTLSADDDYDYEIVDAAAVRENREVAYDDMFDKHGGPVAKAGIDISSLAGQDTVPFKLHLDLKGSESLSFTPIGETTNLVVKGDCATPSFDGNFLPDSRKVTETGFDASWRVISINRTYPQAFVDNRCDDLTESQVKVGLLVPVDSYRKVDRAIKYAFMVIVLTFIAVLFVEIRLRRNINVFQYLLVGLALVLFYSLLLSLSEHVSYGVSYLVAAAMTIVMVTLYIAGVLKGWKMALSVGAMLTLIYGYIFVLLSLETYALLAGSIGLFVVLALIMYYSLKLRTGEIE